MDCIVFWGLYEELKKDTNSPRYSWRMKMIRLFLIMGFPDCGSDDGVKAYNTDPSADIISHEEGASILEAENRM